MYVVALTGGIGSGKSEASNYFATLGVPVIDLDVISHALTGAHAPLINIIASTFGDNYITSDGALDRAKMRKLVFSDDIVRKKLNAILHPAIHQEALKQIESITQKPYALLSIPLLSNDSPYLDIIDRILTIDCDEGHQIQRVKARSQLSELEIRKIIDAQIPRQTRLSMADDVIQNDENIEELHKKVLNLHQKYIKTCIVSKRIS